MKILISGGRDFTDRAKLYRVLRRFELRYGPITCIIEGECPTGADAFAKEWSEVFKVKHKGFPAKWNEYGKAAGRIRNLQMLEEGKPEVVVAFPTGGPGTAHMIEITREAIKHGKKIKLFIIKR